MTKLLCVVRQQVVRRTQVSQKLPWARTKASRFSGFSSSGIRVMVAATGPPGLPRLPVGLPRLPPLLLLAERARLRAPLLVRTRSERAAQRLSTPEGRLGRRGMPLPPPVWYAGARCRTCCARPPAAWL